jgi:hypothetical protein
MKDDSSIIKTNQTKRIKHGGRVAMSPELKPKSRRINDYEYELIKMIRANHGFLEYVKFMLNTWQGKV